MHFIIQSLGAHAASASDVLDVSRCPSANLTKPEADDVLRPECDAEEHPARRGGGDLTVVVQTGEAPRLVTRGESNTGGKSNTPY